MLLNIYFQGTPPYMNIKNTKSVSLNLNLVSKLLHMFQKARNKEEFLTPKCRRVLGFGWTWFYDDMIYALCRRNFNWWVFIYFPLLIFYNKKQKYCGLKKYKLPECKVCVFYPETQISFQVVYLSGKQGEALG